MIQQHPRMRVTLTLAQFCIMSLIEEGHLTETFALQSRTLLNTSDHSLSIENSAILPFKSLKTYM